MKHGKPQCGLPRVKHFYVTQMKERHLMEGVGHLACLFAIIIMFNSQWAIFAL